jgi:hypothetical protein
MFFNLANLHFADHMLTYGNYGGLNYSAGVVGGTITDSSPPPVDPIDTLFYQHDFVYQKFNRPSIASNSGRATSGWRCRGRA